MKKALISPNENNRIIELHAQGFEVALPLFWVDCQNAVTTDWTYSGGVFSAPPQPTKAELIAKTEAELLTAVQNHLDAGAQTKGYDSIVSACSYAGAPNPFQAEGQSFISWRGNVWAYCYQELAKVQAGTRTIPTVDQLLSELPVRV